MNLGEIGKRFPPPARSHRRVTRRNRDQALNVITPDCKQMDKDLPNVLNFFRNDLISMNKSKLKKNADLLNETLNEHCHHGIFTQWFLPARDVAESKIYKPPPVKCKRKPPSNICKIFLATKRLSLLIYLGYFMISLSVLIF